MAWIHGKDGNYNIRTCDICKMTQVQCKDGDWVAYLTVASMEDQVKCYLEGIKHPCWHSPSEDDK